MAFSGILITRLASIPKHSVPVIRVVRFSAGHTATLDPNVPPTARFDIDQPHYQADHAPGREVVGFGINSEKLYFDLTDYPMPAIRYKRETPEIKKLREKEKGDWKNLTKEEKKELYRYSFRQTYAEMDTPTGRWKSIFGWSFFFHGVCLWWFLFIYYLVNGDGSRMRDSLSLEARQVQLQRLIAMRANPITGIASRWDYEKEEWKRPYPNFNSKWDRYDETNPKPYATTIPSVYGRKIAD